MESETVPPTDDPTHVSAATDQPPKILPQTGTFDVSDQFWSLDQRNVRIGQITSSIFSALIFTGLVIALIIIWLNIGLGTLLYSLVAGAIAISIFLFLAAWLWPRTEHRHSSWRLDKEGLEIRRGVFWRHQITIPLGRVQHADVSQGPLQRMFEVGTLTINTAGTQNASVSLEGIAYTTAVELRDCIVAQRKDQHVV